MAFPVLAADLSGTWIATVQTDAGSGSPKFVFKQEGEKLTGTYTGQLGESKLTGTVKGADVEFQFEVSGAQVSYWGKVDDAGTKIVGELDLGGQAKGTFSAEKQK